MQVNERSQMDLGVDDNGHKMRSQVCSTTIKPTEVKDWLARNPSVYIFGMETYQEAMNGLNAPMVLIIYRWTD